MKTLLPNGNHRVSHTRFVLIGSLIMLAWLVQASAANSRIAEVTLKLGSPISSAMASDTSIEPVQNFRFIPGYESATLLWSPSPLADFLKYYVYADTTEPPTRLVDSTADHDPNDTMRTYVGLQPGYTYYARVTVVDTAYRQSPFSDEISYTVPIQHPDACTKPATDIGPMSASLHATVQPHRINTVIHFEYGTTCTYGMSTPDEVIDSAKYDSVSALVTGLIPKTVYHYRIVATNRAGTGYGADMSFTTTGLAPFVETLHADSITPFSAKLNGSVNPNDDTATAGFEYGPTTDYGTTVAAAEGPLTGSSPLPVAAFIGGLQSNTVYHFRALAVAAMDTVFGNDAGFLTLPAAPLLVSPANGAADQPLIILLRWTMPAHMPPHATSPAPLNFALHLAARSASAAGNVHEGDADSVVFGVQVATDSQFVDKVVDDSTITGDTLLIGPLAHDQLYYWRANARNASGAGGYSEVRTFRTIIESPPAPILAAPLNHAADQPLALSLLWHPAAQASSYRVQISTDSLFSTGVLVDDSALTDTSRAVAGLVNATRYYWRVEGMNAGGAGAWSEVWDFRTIVQLPARVVLVAPADGATVTVDPVSFVWERSVPEVIEYRLTIAADSLFGAVALDTLVMDTTISVGSFTINQRYWWKVAAHNAAGWGPSSDTRTFERLVTGVAGRRGLPASFALHQNYPNPFNPSTTIDYDLPSASAVSLKVYNIVGAEVLTLVSERMPAGYHSVRMDAGALPSGMYFVRIQAAEFMSVRKMILMK